MNCIQLNLHKAQLASIELHNDLRDNLYIALITEPYLYKGRLVNIPKGYKTYLGVEPEEQEHTARTAVYVPSSIPSIRIDSICNKDCTAVTITTIKGKMLMCSIYLDIKKEVDPQWLQEVMDYAENNSLRVLIAMDSNSHSQLFCLLYTSDAADE